MEVPCSGEDRHNGCARIRTVYDYPGWVREEDLCGPGDPVDCSALVQVAHVASAGSCRATRNQHEDAGAAVDEARARPGTFKGNAKTNHSAVNTKPN